VLWFWLFVGPALALAAAALWGEKARAAYISDALAADPDVSLPVASVIVPVTGGGPEIRRMLDGLRAQDYPKYEVLIVAQNAGNIPPDGLPSGVIVVLPDESIAVAGVPDLLMLAIRMTRKNTQVIAFADGGGEYSKD